MKRTIQKLTLMIALTGLMACQQTSTPNLSESKTSEELPLGQGVVARSGVSLQEERFQAEVINLALEKLGYQTAEIKELDYSAMYVAIANQDLDFTPAHYIRGHIKFFENAGGSEKLERLGKIVDPVTQAYKIDRRTAQEYQITNLEQLKDSKIAQLFDTDGDGKANLAGCNTGWRCEQIIEYHINAYGLQETVEQDSGNYFAVIADGITRYKQGEPILFYTWTPLWLNSVLQEGKDVTSLEVNQTKFPEDLSQYTEKDTTVNGKNLGLLVDQTVILANQEFLAANPVAQALFELIQIPVEDISAENNLIQNGENQPEDIRRHAEEWVQQNQVLFNSWVEAAQGVQEFRSSGVQEFRSRRF